MKKADDFEIVYGGKPNGGSKGRTSDVSDAIESKVLPILDRIERNTSKISGASRDIVAATRHASKGGPESSGGPALAPSSAPRNSVREAHNAPVARRNANVDRTSNGRFAQRPQAASAAKNADTQTQRKAAQNDAATRRGFLSSLRDIMSGNSLAGRVVNAIKGGDSADLAGTAAGGAMWGAAKEAMDAFGDLKESITDGIGGMFGKKGKAADGEEDAGTVKTLQSNERAEEKRHTEILSALGKVSGGGGGGLLDDVMDSKGKGLGKAGKWLKTGGKILGGVAGAVGLADGLTTIRAHKDESFFGSGDGEGGLLNSRARGYGESALGGAAIGASIGSIIPGLGTAIGAAVGGAIGLASSIVTDNWDSIDGAMGTLSKALGDNTKASESSTKAEGGFLSNLFGGNKSGGGASGGGGGYGGGSKAEAALNAAGDETADAMAYVTKGNGAGGGGGGSYAGGRASSASLLDENTLDMPIKTDKGIMTPRQMGVKTYGELYAQGGQAFAGGANDTATTRLTAEMMKATGATSMNGQNDAYHQKNAPNSGHTQGVKTDFSYAGLSQEGYYQKHQQMSSMLTSKYGMKEGEDFKIISEKHGTGSHIDFKLNDSGKKKYEAAQAANNQEQTALASAAGMGGPNGIGALSSKYESGGNSSNVSYDSSGGTSYGKYQFSSKTAKGGEGSMQDYLRALDKSGDPELQQAAANIRGAGPLNSGSKNGAAADAWKKEAKSDKFQSFEQQYAEQRFYGKQMDNIRKQNPELAKRIEGSDALKNVAFSTGAQQGENTSLIAGMKYDPSMSDKDIIDGVYNERQTRFGTLKKNDERMWNNVVNGRLGNGKDSERNAAKMMVDAEQNKKAQGTALAQSTAPAKPEVAQLESPRAADSGAQYATAPAFDTTGLEQRLDALLAATEKQTAQQQRNNGGENAPDVSTMYRTQACNDIAFG